MECVDNKWRVVIGFTICVDENYVRPTLDYNSITSKTFTYYVEEYGVDLRFLICLSIIFIR